MSLEREGEAKRICANVVVSVLRAIDEMARQCAKALFFKYEKLSYQKGQQDTQDFAVYVPGA